MNFWDRLQLTYLVLMTPFGLFICAGFLEHIIGLRPVSSFIVVIIKFCLVNLVLEYLNYRREWRWLEAGDDA